MWSEATAAWKDICGLGFAARRRWLRQRWRRSWRGSSSGWVCCFLFNLYSSCFFLSGRLLHLSFWSESFIFGLRFFLIILLSRADRIEERPRSTPAVVLFDDGRLSEGSDAVGVKMRARARGLLGLLWI
jgi:hypothetical protein